MGLIAHYKLNDDEANTTVVDSKGNNDGVLNVNTNTKSVVGKINKALDFDGTNDFVDVPHSASLDTGVTISVFAWIFPTNSSIYRVIASKRTATFGWEIANSTGILRATLRDATVDLKIGALSLNQWQYVGFTYDGTTLRLYRNEVETGNTTGTSTVDSTGNFEVGSRQGGQIPFEGKIDDVRIYDSVLTFDQIRAIYNNGRGTEIEVPPYISNMMGANF